MSPAEPRSFKITTYWDVSSLSAEQQTSLAGRLDAAVYEASASYPAASQYFVKHVPEDSEIVVGLKIDRVSSDTVKLIADRLLDESMDEAFQGSPEDRPVAEESLLVPA